MLESGSADNLMAPLHRRNSDDVPFRLCQASVAALGEKCDFPEDDLDAVPVSAPSCGNEIRCVAMVKISASADSLIPVRHAQPVHKDCRRSLASRND